MGRLVGAGIDGTGDSLTYLLFADDYFIMVQTTLQEAKLLKQIVGRYCEASGQAINLNKFTIYFGKDMDTRNWRRVSRFRSVKLFHSSTWVFLQEAKEP